MAENTKQRRKLNSTASILLIIASFIFLISATLGTVLTIQSVSKMKEILSYKMLEMSITASSLLDGDSLKNMKVEDMENETPEYVTAYNTLHAFLISNEERGSGEIAYIYCCRKCDDGTYEFTIDPSNDPADWGEKVEETYALNSAWNGTAAYDKEPYTDRWGTFYSAYSPVFDSNHEVVMMVGIDIWADWFNQTVWSSSISIIIVSSVGCISGILLGVVISLRRKKRMEELSKEFNELEGDVQTLLSEIKEPIDASFKENEPVDEMHHIREQIRVTQNEIREYIIYTKRQAYLDSLAQVGNRAAYVEKIKEVKFDSPFAVIIFDINGLKYINDHYGHENGDQAIVAVSIILKNVFDNSSIFRIGGDEFVVLLTDVDTKATMYVFELFDENLEEFNDKQTLPFKVNVSKGIAFYNSKKDKTFVDVFNRADIEMYKAKKEFYENNPELKNKYNY